MLIIKTIYFKRVQCSRTGFIQILRTIVMASYMIYAGIAIGVAAMAGAIVYGTQNQQNYIPDDAIPATEQGAFSSPSGLGAQLNKEK